MNDRTRFSLLFAIAACAFILTLALSFSPAITPNATAPQKSGGSAFKDAARIMLIGRAEDAARQAARFGRRGEFLRATQQLRQLGAAEAAVTLAGEVAIGPAEQAIQQASDREQVLAAIGSAPTDPMSGRSAELYRKALKLDPNFTSADPMKLNALGYFLAEKGKSKEDFQTAERLTRRALDLWTEVLKQMEPDNPRRLVYEYFRAQLARDSMAWALYKQGRYEEARREQETAVTDARRVAARTGSRVAADLYYHLGAIYWKLDRYEAARKQFRAALREDNEHEESLQALEELGGESTPLPELPLPPGPEDEPVAPDENIPEEDEPVNPMEPFDGEPFDGEPFDGEPFEIPTKPDVVPVGVTRGRP